MDTIRFFPSRIGTVHFDTSFSSPIVCSSKQDGSLVSSSADPLLRFCPFSSHVQILLSSHWTPSVRKEKNPSRHRLCRCYNGLCLDGRNQCGVLQSVWLLPPLIITTICVMYRSTGRKKMMQRSETQSRPSSSSSRCRCSGVVVVSAWNSSWLNSNACLCSCSLSSSARLIINWEQFCAVCDSVSLISGEPSQMTRNSFYTKSL